MMTLKKLQARFPDEESCKRYLVAQRWPDGVVCPRCGEKRRVYALKTRPFHWVCKNPTEACPGVYRFSVLTGTIFQDTKYPLRTWFQVAFLMLTAKKGISALQVQRILGSSLTKGKGSYETFWYMCHRLRAAIQHGSFQKLTGVVEVDETYVGGKYENRHAKDRHNRGKGGRKDKVPVVGAIQRNGNVVCQRLNSVTALKLSRFVRQAVDSNVSLVATDENPSYRRLTLKDGLPHEAVNHTRGEYVRGVVHTANLDSFWSLLKRGIIGTYHQVSAKYLPLYLDEFSFRHNNRRNPGIFDDFMALA